MRVIGGSARGHKLAKVPGHTTRPITDRVKENLFNILGDWVVGTFWLDLFAGTGQVGIEALSRGARRAVFVDSEKAAVKVIRRNLEHTRLSAAAEVVSGDAFNFLRAIAATEFDAIYVAPPQYKGLWANTLTIIDQDPDNFLAPQGMIIVQIDPKEFVDRRLATLSLFDQRTYGRTMLCFYELSDSILT